MILDSASYELQLLASSQWGMFTAAQAVGLGMSRVQIQRMADDGRLERMGYCVYRYVAGEVSAHSDVKAAWLSTDPARPAYERLDGDARMFVCASTTAAFLLGIGDFDAAPYTFIAPKGKRTARAGMRYLPWEIRASEVTAIDGLPATVPERTIADLVRAREDRGLIIGALSDYIASGASVRRSLLEELLTPLAARNGYARGDGKRFAEDLLFQATR